MGTINYNSNKYITIGLHPLSSCDFTDKDIEDLKEEIGEDFDIDDYIQDCADIDRENIEDILSKYKKQFNQYKISIESGYYEGFYINIEDEYIYYDDCIEKRATQKEITAIKSFLIECVNNGLVACFPGWCTKYLSYEDSLKMINSAIKEMRQAAKAKPTYKNYHFAIA